MKNGNYVGYKETDISFLPSYKLSKKELLYVDKKDQAPSYCDRVLYKNNSSMKIKELSYDCMHEVYGSDHRPVILKLNIRDFEDPQYCELNDLLIKPSLGYGEMDIELVDIQGLDFSQVKTLEKIEWA